MSVSVRMPQLGESVTEGTVTRWLKKEGELVNADEPLLEVSTDKVDTEIPSPASGVLRGIAVAEEETVEVGAELAVIDETGQSADGQAPAAQPARAQASAAATAPDQPGPHQREDRPEREEWARRRAVRRPVGHAEPAGASPAETLGAEAGTGSPAGPRFHVPSGPSQREETAAWDASAEQAGAHPAPEQEFAAPTPLPGAADGPYITPLVRKLAAEHGVDLGSITGTGVGGRIRKQDVLEVSRTQRGPQAPPAAAEEEPAARADDRPEPAGGGDVAADVAAAAPGAGPAAAVPAGGAQPGQPIQLPGTGQPARQAPEQSPLRGTTERMSRLRQVIAQRMVDSLHTSAQLTTVAEVDMTKIARLRARAKADFEKREGVRLSFLPFFALATLEALKTHPKLNAVIDTEQGEVTYFDVEHLGIAVDTERGLLVPVIRGAGDLNIGGLARKIDDIARRTRSGQVSPDELSGGTFTLTNTGSRGAIFDTPIINQPQVAILGTGAVVKRPVVLDEPKLGEVIAVRSMVYLSLTYDHRLVDGADAARFLTSVRTRLEEGTFEAGLGL